MPERYLGHSFGKYRVDSLVGSGGFAWVFKGYDPELEIPVAIKVLKPQFAGDDTLVDRFRREASTAAKLRHPNIIKIYAVGKEGDAVYFVMDFLPSGLADKLETTSTLPEDYVVRIGIDVARALGFAHREGVIHRDIKVDNILFDSHGNAVVADFGIARAVTGYTQHTGTNMVVGTPQYFAPEQARAKPLDGRADIYSLGVTLYRASTGRLPFEGDDWYEIARQHVEEPPPAPRTITPTLTSEFEQVVLRCLAKPPEERPATGELLAEQLELILSQHRDPTISRTITVPSLANTLVTPAFAGPKAVTRRMTWQVLAPSALAVIAIGATAWLMLSGGTAGGTIPPTNPDSGPPTLVFGDSGLLVDAAARRRDSARRAAALSLRGRLKVTVPADAQLTVNGVPVKTTAGVWAVDTMQGDYSLHATVSTVPECTSATRDTTIKLAPTQIRDRITLNPRPCGIMEITLRRPEKPLSGEARYTIVSADGATTRNGALRIDTPFRVVLPIGVYRINVNMGGRCFPYSDEGISITASDVPVRIPITPICS